MRLFLCEKPSQARDIARVLGAGKREDGYLSGSGVAVSWAIGHLLETAPPDAYDPALKSWSLETLPILPEQWKMTVKSGTAAQFKIVKKLLAGAKEVVIATDADREGEMIARELMDYCGYRGSVKRLWLSALNDESIRKALAELKDGAQTFPLYHSALGRSRADWLIGMNLTRLFTRLANQSGYEGVLSVGRVQTPTLKLVVDRDREIKGFVPMPFWTLDVVLEGGGVTFTSSWLPQESFTDSQRRCINESAADEAQSAISAAGTASVTDVTVKRVKDSPPLPFELSELQSVCSARFGLGAQDTLNVAQALYETHKATTYPRTDCSYLPDSMLVEASKVVAAIVKTDSSMQSMVNGLDLSLKSRAWNEKKVAEAAHHGIIPTDSPASLSAMSDIEKKVYDLIRRRYLAQFAPAHEYDHTIATFDCGGQVLRATGRKIIVTGWKSIITGRDDETEEQNSQTLPQLTKNESCTIKDVVKSAKTTTPPPHYTEGTLITAMKNVAKLVTDERLRAKLKETTGIGTNATRAGIIQGLIDRGFVKKQKKALIASDAAYALIKAVPSAVSSVGTTAIWEQALEMVEKGQLTLDDFVARQKQWITQIVDNHRGSSLDIQGAPSPACPECGSPMRKRKTEKSSFWGCSKYPDCKGIIFEDNKPKKTRKTTPRKTTKKRTS